MVPSALNGTDFMITTKPVETVQVEPGCCVDVLRREGSAAAAVEQHQGAPVFFRVGALNLTQEFLGFAGLMIMLHAEKSKRFIALVPEFNNIATAEHVAVHEDRPALIAHEVRNYKASEGEGRTLIGVSLTPI